MPTKTKSNKPEPANNDGPPLSKSIEQRMNEDVTIDDEDDDELMFDEEEFETVTKCFYFSVGSKEELLN